MTLAGVSENAAPFRRGGISRMLLQNLSLAMPALVVHTEIQVWLGGHWFTVVGLLGPAQLVSLMNSMASIGFPSAEHDFSLGDPAELFLRAVYTKLSAVITCCPRP